jgi:MFS family permease
MVSFSALRRVILKFYVYKGVSALHLTGPIWVLFLLSRDMSYAQIGALDSLFAAVILLGEIPTGYLGDRIGRRNSLLIGTTLGSIGSIGFAFGASFGSFAVLYALLALGRTFETGTESAWLYDILQEQLDESEFARIQGRGNAVSYVMSGGAAILGGIVGDVNLAYPWLISGGATAFAALVLLTFPETDHGDDSETFTVLDALPIIRSRLLDPSLRTFILFTALFYAVLGSVNYFVQPVSRDLGLEISQIGVLYAGFTGLSAVVSYNSGFIKDALGIDRWFTVTPVLLGAAFATVLFAPLVALPVFFLMMAVRNASKPLEHQYLNDRVESLGRATVLSSVSMVHSLVLIPFQVAAGGVATLTSPLQTIALLGGLLVVVTALSSLLSASAPAPFTNRQVGD